MARSRARLLLAASAAAALPLALACNDIIGLSDFERGECPGARCGDGSAFDAAIDTGVDAAADAPAETGGGADEVSWARWPMPDHDASAPVSVAYTAGAGEVEDGVTGLVWKQPMPPEAATRTFEQARALCAGLPGGPWRLPKRIELVTLLHPEGTATRIDQETFPGTVRGPYWTSSEVRGLNRTVTGEFWIVNFDSALLGKADPAETVAVRCVKGTN
jgi:hypothetical protein